MREPPKISEEHLRARLEEQYGFTAFTLAFLALGLDSRAGAYRIVSEQAATYLVKVTSRPLYEPAYRIPRALRDAGIASVVAPLPTAMNSLWTQVEGWTVSVYPYIAGETSWSPGLTNAQWKRLGATAKQIHQTSLPPEALTSLRAETFAPAKYARWAHTFEARHAAWQGRNQSEQTLLDCWQANQLTIHTALASLTALARALRRHSGPFVICHADLHPGNVIRDQNGQVFVIDWGDVMLAPKERDFLFVGAAPADDAAGQDIAPFFQGYGQAEIDWVALTYYLWERVVQDLIECARDVFFRKDLEEATRAEAAQLFCDVLADGGEVTTAQAATARLPSAYRPGAR